jgi:outer membrane protein TolC
LQHAVADSQHALQQASQLYARGLSAYLPVLVAQRSLNQARDALALSQLAQLQGGIALYKALGAGWSDTALVPEHDQCTAAGTTAMQ